MITSLMDINIMSFTAYNYGYIWFGVRAQNLLRWMAVENRCGLGVGRVDKYSQSHIWTDDGRTLGRAPPPPVGCMKISLTAASWPSIHHDRKSEDLLQPATGLTVKIEGCTMPQVGRGKR